MAITLGSSKNETTSGLSINTTINVNYPTVLIMVGVTANCTTGNCTAPVVYPSVKINGVSLPPRSTHANSEGYAWYANSASVRIFVAENVPIGNATLEITRHRDEGYMSMYAVCLNNYNGIGSIGTAVANEGQSISLSLSGLRSGSMIFNCIAGTQNNNASYGETILGSGAYTTFSRKAMSTGTQSFGIASIYQWGVGAMVSIEMRELVYKPIISSSPTVDGIFATGAVGHANITSDQGYAITERGWVLNTSANPTTSHTKFTTAGTTGSYDTEMTGLLPETTYYARPFATNAEGTTYGDQVEFTTTSSFSPHIIGSLALAVAVMI